MSVTRNKIDKLVNAYFDNEEVSTVMIKNKLGIITKYWNDERLPILLFALYEPLYERIESNIQNHLNHNTPIYVSEITSFIDKNIFKRLIKSKTINEIYDGVVNIIMEHTTHYPNVKLIKDIPDKDTTTKGVLQKGKPLPVIIEKMFKKFTTLREKILKQIDKETKLKTIKAKINAIEKALELLVELKNSSTEILSTIKNVGGYKQTKQSVVDNIKDIEERLFTRYDELMVVHDTPTKPTTKKNDTRNPKQIKKDIKKIYEPRKPTRAELEDPLSVLSPRSRTKAEKALSKIVIRPEDVLPLLGQNVFETKPKTPKPKTPSKSFEEKEKNKTYEQLVEEREQQIKNNEKKVKGMTNAEILEELRKYGWTKIPKRTNRRDLEEKLLFSMEPTGVYYIPDEYE